MSDLSTNGLLQQLSAKEVSGEHLEVLGKQASSMWCEGRVKTLNDAVVETVKHAGLSPEQVKRVIEFTNTSAYLTEFRKEGAGHKVVDFGDGGPASPSAVLQDLNDGGGGSVFDPGTGDYNQPPREKTAASDARLESAFAEMFHAVDAPLPLHDPHGPAIELRDKLAGAYEQATSQISMLENMFDDLRGRVFFQVKQASLSGVALSEVAEIWHRYAPSDEHVKVAFQLILPKLIENGVFMDGEAAAESFQKIAHVGVVNEEHPLVVDFKDFCETLQKLAEVREFQIDAGEGLAQIKHFLKTGADTGLLQRGAKALGRAAGVAEEGGKVVGDALLGKGKGKYVGKAAKGLTYALPAVGAHEVYRRTLKYDPTFQGVKRTALGAIPGTQEYNQKEYELAMNGQGAY